MKKQYQAPQTGIFHTETMNLICASLGDGDTPNAKLGEAGTSQGGMRGDSRRAGSWWDDED